MPDLSLSYRAFDDAGVSSPAVVSTKSSGQIVRTVEAVPANQSNYPVACAFTLAKLVAVYVSAANADGSVVTVETNSGSSPQETFALKGNGPPLQWNADHPTAAPFAGSVTGLFVTNAAACTLTVFLLVDPT